MQTRLVLLLMTSMIAPPTFAQESRDAVLLIDRSATTMSGARARLGFERFPREGEAPVWHDPTGRLDSVAVSLLAGGGLIGFGVADAHAQAQRNATIEPLRAALAQDGMLERLVRDALIRTAIQHGYVVSKVMHHDAMSAGAAARAIDAAEGHAIAIERYKGQPVVAFSWDDRQPLLAFQLRVYKERRGEPLKARELRAQGVRYVGRRAAASDAAAAFWSADQGARMREEIETALASMLEIASTEALDVPSIPGKETTMLTIDGEAQVFPGRLWKTEGALTFLYTADGGVTLVRTDAFDERPA